MNTEGKRNLLWVRAATVLLWILTCAVGLVAIYSIIRLSVLIFAVVTGQGMQTVGLVYTGVFVGQIAAVVSGGLWLVAAIWSGEYAIKHVGERRLWKVFAWMLGVELFLIFMALFFGLL